MVAISGSGWRLAPCLVELFEEADKRDPNRDRTSDGTIGDVAHSARTSDHNPDDGWVCAADIDDDDDQANPGVDLLRAHLVATQDPRVKYLIRNGTIWKAYANNGLPAWTPQVYTGLNDHSHHLHISVWNTAEARNDLSPWWPAPQPQPAPLPIALPKGEQMLITRQDDTTQSLLFLGGKLFKGHNGAVKGNAETPRVAVTADVWGDLITAFGPVID